MNVSVLNLDGASVASAGLMLGRLEYSANDIERHINAARVMLAERGEIEGRELCWQGEVGLGALAVALVATMEGASCVLAKQRGVDTSAVLSSTEFEQALVKVNASEPSVSIEPTSFQPHVSALINDYVATLSACSVVAIAAPLTHHYLLLIWACWQADHTVCIPETLVLSQAPLESSSAAACIRQFELGQPQMVVADHAVLQSMMQHPAIDLADLASVEHLLVICPSSLEALPTITQLWPETIACQFAFAWRNDWLEEVNYQAMKEHASERINALLSSYPIATSGLIDVSLSELEVNVQLAYTPEQSADRLVQARTLIEHAIPNVNQRFPVGESLTAVQLTQEINQIALRSMLNGLWRCGVLRHDTPQSEEQLMAQAEVAPEHRVLIKRWLKVLSKEQLLEESAAGYRLITTPDTFSDQALTEAFDELAPRWQACMGSCGTIDYARANAKAVPELIRGQRQAVHLLFPEGKTEFARALYRENQISQYQHQQVANLVKTIAKQAGQGPIRILEVGAGTGATSEAVLPELAGLEVEYHYTDVSAFFFEQVGDAVKQSPSVTLGLYDIDVTPEEQAFALHSFDIIIGGGVLNAARHTVSALQRLRRLLRPGGWLLITEPVLEEYWVMASQAFMLQQAEDDRSSAQATFLSLQQWQRALDDAGFIRLVEQPEHDHPFYQSGHFVFVATTLLDYTPLPFAELHTRLSDATLKRVSLSVQP